MVPSTTLAAPGPASSQAARSRSRAVSIPISTWLNRPHTEIRRNSSSMTATASRSLLPESRPSLLTRRPIISSRSRIDWVANHTAWDCSWVKDHKDWYAQDSGGNVVNPKLYGSSGAFGKIKDRLDDIKALGTDVFYLMPIYQQGTKNAIGSPYCIKDFKAVNTSYGSLEDLRALVDAAHAKGMKVMFDWVASTGLQTTPPGTAPG